MGSASKVRIDVADAATFYGFARERDETLLCIIYAD